MKDHTPRGSRRGATARAGRLVSSLAAVGARTGDAPIGTEAEHSGMQQSARKRSGFAPGWLALLVLAGPGAAAAQDPAPVPLDEPVTPPAQEGEPPAPQETPVTASGDSPAEAPAAALDPMRAYFFLEDRDALLARWSASALVERLELGTSAGGRELFGVQFGSHGPRPLAERATIFLVGGLDGVSLAGSQAVIAIVTALLEHPDQLPPDAAFVALPWANPDGLARYRSLGTGGGRNDRSIDDDGDGKLDEDGPDDLDKNDEILEMLIEDPTGSWARAGDPRFLRAAREGEAPRFRRLREGADDDGDGQFNEDGPGGVLLDHNFPIGWEDVRGSESGPWPLSEPDTDALAKLMLARRTAVVLVFQGNHGLLASPGGRVGNAEHVLPMGEDEPTYRRLAEVFAAHTARLQPRAVTLAEARGEAWPGSLVDWSYAALGALAMEVGVWGPAVQPSARGPVDAFFRDSETLPSSGITPVEEAWARWLDETRGGIGFLEWQPIELAGVSNALVGGWERDTRQNPPLDVLPQALGGLSEFTLDLARNLPRLEVEVLRDTKREGRVCLVKARVKNLGTLPSGVGPGAQTSSVRLRLEITPGVTLRAGQLETVIGHLPGRGVSDEFSWLLIAPENAVVRIVAESAWSPPSVREVRP